MSDVNRPAPKPADAQWPAPAEPQPEKQMEAATASEIRIKLDLARQFLDLGDPESARHILDEVLAEGDSSQKKEAMRLVDTLP
jgi:pilus assembly protein FimV